ncbi:hypothetical protein PR003_g26517 [Phytophthora rubi]|uniref:Uncharacterized protein n=1 Tax=Phytophthora rubi TaxID=129364 RepID=A0A6A3I5L4_9STRA|nr:hypothetical protein PR001_g25251 [Phytophthora rubi]KAE9285672.1 hypothetical protein PR003_g26517 [Phytophthora rubi]
MGRNRDPVRKQFRDTKERINQQNDTYHECLHCIGAKEELAKTDKDEAAKIVIAKIHGSVASLRRYLERCEHTPETRMAREAAAALEGTPVPIQAPEGQRQLSLGQVGLVIKRLLEFQARHRLADAFIEDDTTRRLVESLDPRFVEHMPCRRTFGGPILKKRAMEVIEEEADDLMNLQRQSGGRVNFLSDVWMNIAKAHLLAAQLGLFGVFTTLGLSPTGSRHDGLELASQMEKLMEEAEAGGWNIGGVVTDDAAQCGRARRILALRWPRVIFVKCFAHDMNNLMKSVLRINEFRSVSNKAQQIVKFLNASSAKWLPRAHEVMIQTYGRNWRFKALCPTRWNSMQGCFASLLRVKTAMRIFAVKYSASRHHWLL